MRTCSCNLAANIRRRKACKYAIGNTQPLNGCRQSNRPRFDGPCAERFQIRTIRHPCWQIALPRQRPPAERTAQQLEDIRRLHVAAEGTQKLPGSERPLNNAARKQRRVTFRSQPVHHRARQRRRVDVCAFKPFVPVPLIVDDPALDILLPKRGSSISA